MKKRKNIPACTIVAFLLAVLTNSCSALEKQSAIRRTELQRYDLNGTRSHPIAGKPLITMVK